MFKKNDYKITHRSWLFDLSKISDHESVDNTFKVKPCPLCLKTPKVFYEGRYKKDGKWIYDGIYVVIECAHHRNIKSEKKCRTNIPRTLLNVIDEWNKQL